jgi:hypothetical protein
MSFILLGILNSQVPPSSAASSFELLESTILGSDTASVTFSSIPTTGYRHLHLRAVMRSTRAAATDSLRMRLNADSGTNYASHRLVGNGSTVTSAASTGDNIWDVDAFPGNTDTSGSFGLLVMDILDAFDTNKNKTIRHYAARNGSANQLVRLTSGLWVNTAAVTSISLDQNVGPNWLAGSRFSLYGVK